ncbi:hypothetical protein KL935_002113 [Ogataea polymorpha]|nr:hypothetical protein KL937_001531 [Ogataea polymorpha]KAG7894199.1 hypothetical protein KL908_002476 [Ogataea polymorpha]KAG7902153.1 hypothetical protein KL935_002113 [Ogataea polymorpha]KAG7918266.1 hypothetical protein KL927_001723 [Ogataea polymorpha]KAG7938998.1 hypothetical protein KL904_001527 [Ogataea polymorpha]
MAKRKVKRSVEQRQIKRQKDEDAKLASGIFNNYDKESDESFDEDEEQDYELRPRQFKKDQELEERLPVKLPDGTFKRVLKQKEVESEESEESEEMESEQHSSKESESESESDQELTPQEKLIKTKEEIARIAEQIMEDPEEHVKLLARLRRMANSKNPNTSKLSLLAAVPIFKSIAPAYRIRPLTEIEKKQKVSKDVAKLRYFEETLVFEYKHYVDLLTQKARVVSTTPKATELDKQLGILANNAACELALALRFFNYRKELFQIVVKRAVRKPASESEFKVYERSIQTIEELFKEDADHGDISVDLAILLNRAIRTREFKVDESVVNVFLALSILDDYDPNSTEEEKQLKLKKKDRVHLSKKERKQRKERKQIEKELRAAEQAVSAEERERNQAQVLKILVTLYLEILRARPEKLMAPVLEGLAKYGHQVNIDLIGDFLQILREICENLLQDINEEGNFSSMSIRQVLLAIVTSFSLTANLPTKRMSVDLNKFVQYLYTLLPTLALDPDMEFSHKTLRLVDPLAATQYRPNVNIATKSELLLRCLDYVFFNSRSGSGKRSIAFTKRIYSFLLQAPEKTAIAGLKFVDKLMARYEDIKGLYTTEDRIQNGVYHAEQDSIELANADVAVIWENVLLESHYCPTLAAGVNALMKRAK